MASSGPAAETALFSALLEAAADAIIVIDDAGSIRQTNSACARVFGYELTEMLGRNVSMLMPDHYRREHDGYLRRYRETGEAKIIGIGRQVEGRRSDGVVFPMDLSVGEGRFAGERLFVGIVRDLTDRHQLVEALRQQEAELRQMLDSAVVPTGLIDGEGRLASANGALSSFLERKEVRGADLASYLQKPHHHRLNSALAELAGSPAVRVLRLVPFSVRDIAKTADMYLASFQQSDVAGQGHGIVVQLVNHTPQIEAERALSESREELAHYQRVSALAAMTTGIAHEVNQPMGAIANYAEAGQILLGKEQIPVGELTHIFQQISQQTERASDVIRRLRSLSQGHGPAREEVPPAELVAEAVRLYGPQFELRGLRIETKTDTEGCSVSVDRVQILQVLLNLLQNAVDAMADSSDRTIELDTRVEQSGVVFSVRDRGTGVSLEIADRITNPFFSSKEDGMGIGLAVCRTIAEKHGGRLWFDNNADGPGATFSILIPESKGD